MFPEEFFIERPHPSPFGIVDRIGLDKARLQALRQLSEVNHSDVEVAAALARLVHNEFEAYGTDGSQRCDSDEIMVAVRTLRAVLGRLQIDWALPFSDFTSFRTHWVNEGAKGSWQARRELLGKLFDGIHDRLAQLEDDELAGILVEPVTAHPGTGWVQIDTEINELRRHFQSARSPQDYRNVGNDCVAVLERLSAQVYEREVHLNEGEDEPPVANTKLRIGRFVEQAASGSGNSEIRKVARAVIELSQAIKHQKEPSRRDAGIAADSVIQLANLLRRLSQE